jgi:CheY-like chemotaxis protein
MSHLIERRRVLYVEDDAMDLLLMQRAFSAEGKLDLLLHASDGAQAIAWLGGTGPYADRSKYPLPDVTVLDMRLPGASGLDVLRWIRNHPELATLPVIMFSGSDLQSDMAEAYVRGASLYLSKTTGEGLQAIVRFILGWLELSPAQRAYKKEWRSCTKPPASAELRSAA